MPSSSVRPPQQDAKGGGSFFCFLKSGGHGKRGMEKDTGLSRLRGEGGGMPPSEEQEERAHAEGRAAAEPLQEGARVGDIARTVPLRGRKGHQPGRLAGGQGFRGEAGTGAALAPRGDGETIREGGLENLKGGREAWNRRDG